MSLSLIHIYKLLYPYKGKALYRHTLDRILETGEAAEIYVVSQYPQLLEEIKELPVTPVYSPRSLSLIHISHEHVK